MPMNFINPYSGQEEESCSVSFGVQQQVLGNSTGSAQTEAQYNKSKLLGEIGVMKGKLANGQIPDGTKVLAYESADGYRGFYFVKGGELKDRLYKPDGTILNKEGFTSFSNAEYLIGLAKYKVSIPQAVSPKPKPEPVPFTKAEAKALSDNPNYLSEGEIIAVNAAGDFLTYSLEQDVFSLSEKQEYGSVAKGSSYILSSLMGEGEWFKPESKTSTKPKTVSPATPPLSQVAAPTATAAVNPASESAGSMSDEDVSAMFVKIKDDLAKEKGLNIKGANAELDALVYKEIGEKTGYTGIEVKGKIDAYKAAGNKLSALKKKVLAGTKKVPEGKPQPTKATPAAPLNVAQATSKPAQDPKPFDKPTVATPKLAEEVKAAVAAEVKKEPQKVYSDEDVAAQYIMRKDEIVAASNGKWTLYTKSDELDLDIAIAVGLKTGLNPLQQKQAIANYLGSGKKLSVLKKQLIKQGAMKPQAETLKKSGAAKTQAEKDAEVEAKAASGYTPTSTPSTTKDTGTPTETGKNPTKAHVKADAQLGDISGVDEQTKKFAYQYFKDTLSNSYLTSTSGQNYDGFSKALTQLNAYTKKDYTLLQMIRMVDEEGAKKFGVENTHVFETKVVKWLTTHEGTAYIKANEEKLAKQAEMAKKKAEAEKMAKELEANQPPLPADSRQFEEMTPEKALQAQLRWLTKKPFGPGEKSGLTHYTGGAYRAMNGHLRAGESVSAADNTAIAQAKRGFRPSDMPMLLRRGTGANQFITLGAGRGEAHLLWGMTGKTFEDKGFLSTSAAGRAAFGGEVMMEIEAPVGTPMMYVDKLQNPDGSLSRFSQHQGENEMLLSPNLKYKILNVRKEGSTYIVRIRVVDWPGKAN